MSYCGSLELPKSRRCHSNSDDESVVNVEIPRKSATHKKILEKNNGNRIAVEDEEKKPP